MKIILKLPGNRRIDLLELVICTMIVLSPMLQQHKGFYINGGWSALVLGLPFCIARYAFGKWKIKRSAAFGLSLLAVYYLYVLVDHGFSSGDFIKVVILMIYYLALTRDDFNYRYIVYIATAIALAACVGLVMQYISYYVFHRKLQFLSVSTFLETSTRWVNRISSTEITSSFYRPSSIFLEPSHMSLFAFPTVLYLLFHEDANKKTRLIGFIIIGGVIMSTSGMGVAFSMICIFAYYVMYKKPTFKKGNIWNIFSLRSVLLIVTGAVLLLVLYNNVDFVYRTIVRIIAEDASGYNAFSGRTTAGQQLLASLKGRQLLVGVTDAMGEAGSGVSGFQATFYKYGLIGIAISYLYYGYGFLRCSKNYRYLCALVIVFSFFCAHSHNYFYMLYYGAHIFEGLKKGAVRSRARQSIPAPAVTLREYRIR